ncbi:MAG TPA: hypothetical protein DCS28_01660 [Candidatus Moranbacteria bacterium]|nr:hypothetical protein [Candidatus Moranbacteria bacterium]
MEKRRNNKLAHVDEKIEGEFDSFLDENNLRGRFGNFLELIDAKITFVSENTLKVFMGKIIAVYFEKYVDKKENYDHYNSTIVTAFGELTFQGANEWTCYRKEEGELIEIEGTVVF